MFDTTHKILDDHTHHYAITRHGDPVSYADALNLWQHDENFRRIYLDILTGSPFSAFRWETPPVTKKTMNRHFEFVLLSSPGLNRSPDTQTFAGQFVNAGNENIAVFENLGGDALLVVPTPVGPDASYIHLAAFIRGAPDRQKHAMWRIVGRTMQEKISDEPLWLSTAGGGVAWVHIRLDSRPKYYGHAPYRNFG